MFTLPDLPYAYNALEPYIDEATMRVHHDKHHKTYMDKLNAALEKYPAFYEKKIQDVLSDLSQVPEDARTAVKNHGGGYLHHALFWQMMKPDGGGNPTGKIAEAITETFGSFQVFKEKFSASAAGLFGSGWTWLVKDGQGKLSILNTPNQDSPVSQGFQPLLALDVWEHAYYLSYQNRRPEYIEKWWNVVHWEEAENRYKAN